MKAGATVANEESDATEDALRLVVDTTPALIHTGRPDGYLDYFNRGWLNFVGTSLEEVWLALDQLYSRGRRSQDSSEMARRFGKRRTVRSRSACSAR